MLYEAKSAGLVLYGRALGLSHWEAEDVIQETFIALLRMSGFPADAENYAVRAYRNRALNYRRGLWRRLRREMESLRWFEASEEESPAERRLMGSLEKLPAEQREVVVLKIWHGYTFEQIAAVTAVSPNTAAGRYRYALRKLREVMHELTYEPGHGSSLALMGAAKGIAQS